jgi:hypothetical protein
MVYDNPYYKVPFCILLHIDSNSFNFTETSQKLLINILKKVGSIFAGYLF